MPKHNNEIPNNHFKKCAVWQSLIKTWFEQPARNKRRRLARAAKAKAVFPRPTAGPLRPVVHSSSIRYNMKTRAGRGFSLDELKEAGIPVKLAPTIGVAVDWRRKNKCLESLQENANRLKAYKAKLILFPRKKTAKAGDSSATDCATATQYAGEVMRIKAGIAPVALESVAITAEMKAVKAYQKLRVERMNARLMGFRKKRAEDLAAEEKEKAKMK